MRELISQRALVVSVAILASIVIDASAVPPNDSAFVKIANVGAEDAHVPTLFVTDSEELRARIGSGRFATLSTTTVVIPSAALSRFVEYVRQHLRQERFAEACSADLSDVPMTIQLSIEEKYEGGGPSVFGRDCWRLSPDRSEPFLKELAAWLSTAPGDFSVVDSEIRFRLSLVAARLSGRN
jgi:hypothetical protein